MSAGGFIRRTLYWTKDFLQGRPVGKHYRDIRLILCDSTEGKVRQMKALNDLLQYAVRNSMYYSSFDSSDIRNFPVVNKSVLIENHSAVEVSVEHIPEQKNSEIYIQRTSGSTGTPFSVPADTRKRNRRIAELKYFGAIGGYKSHEKMGQCRVWTKWHNKSKRQQFMENILAINISKMDDEVVENLIHTVRKEKVVALLGYANWFDQVVAYLAKHPTDLPSLKVIFTGSEMLKEQTRTELKRLIGCNVLERYSNEEQGILGQQSIYGGTEYYLNHASYYFEILKLDSDEPANFGELGRIVVTDLYNYAFPMIRYDTGDTGVAEAGNNISRNWMYISKLYGRRLDLIFDKDGNPIQPMALARVLKNLKGIVQWQFIQKGRTEYTIRLNTENELSVAECVAELKELLGKDAEITVEIVDEIPVLASGKRKPVLQEWKR